MSKKPRNFYFLNQVYKRNAKEVRNGRLQTSYHSHANQLQLSKDDDSKSKDQRQYRSMIASLLYVTTSRLDVMKKVGHVARFHIAPNESRVLAVKRIFKYLKGKKEFGLWYSKGKDLSLLVYLSLSTHLLVLMHS